MTEKTQFNLFVEAEAAESFRKFAYQKGYGRKPSPLLNDLLAVYRPNYLSLFKRLEEVLHKSPELSLEDIENLRRIRSLIDEAVKQ